MAPSLVGGMISVSRHRLPSAFPANPIFPTKLFQERCVPLSTDPCRIGFLIGFDPVSSVYGNSKDVISRCISQKISDNFEPGNEDSPIQVVLVPGSFEIGTTSQILGKSGKYHAVLCISAVVKGDTSHYDAVVNSATSGILSAGLNSEGREMVRILLAAGANPSAQDAQQQTALHTAAMANDEELVTIILATGVDVNIRNLHNTIPLHVALARGAKSCIGLLLSAGAEA